MDKMLEAIKRKDLKIFFIAWLVNSLENLILLLFFDVPITKNTLIGSVIFALIFFSVYKLIIGGES